MMASRKMASTDEAASSYRERVALCTTSYDLLRLIKEVTTDYEFRFFSIVRLPSSRDEELSELAMLHNWPEELVRRYDEMLLLKQSPVYEKLKTTTKPVFWSTRASSRYLLSEVAAEVRDMFYAQGMRDGVHFSVQEPGGKRASVSFSGDRTMPTETELAELNYIANLVYERLFELSRSKKTSKTQKLSAREGECLMWTASGKTSAEIAIILKLSEHTVNHYLTAACQKLGATNRAHAVYKAMRAGYLD